MEIKLSFSGRKDDLDQSEPLYKAELSDVELYVSDTCVYKELDKINRTFF